MNTSDWPLIVGAMIVSLLLVPLFLYVQLVIRPPVLAGISVRVIGLVAMVPGVAMGGVGLWMAARG